MGSKNFSRTLTAHVAHLTKCRLKELWFQDEARIGQKNGRSRIWTRKGTRPRLPADQRYKNTYLFGAICPKRGVGVALVLPRADTQAMQLHLNEISKQVDTIAHAVVLMDRAGRYSTGKLKITKNLTNILLPPKSPKLNPVKLSGNTCERTNSQAVSLIPTRPSLRPPMRHGTRP